MSEKKFADIRDASLDVCTGMLPDYPNGGAAAITAENWAETRKQILDTIIPLCYGGMPPKPEYFQVHRMYSQDYRIIAGTAEKQLAFEMSVQKPAGDGPFPVILTGDAFTHYLNDNLGKMFLDAGYAIARFNRTVLAEDTFTSDRSFGLYPVYPELKFSMLSAWAWGYHRCVDALLTLDYVDPNAICVTGHSRGGKAALLAGATDERIAFTAPSGSGLFGGGCFRYTQYVPEDCDWCGSHTNHSETLLNMMGCGVPWPAIQFWFGKDMAAYMGDEDKLPFDLHFLKAAVAPRYLLQTDSVEDIWANPRGSYLTHCAAREVFKALGAEDRIAYTFRYGPHGHKPEDFHALFCFINAAMEGRPYLKDNGDNIYGHLKKIHDWSAEK